MDEAERRFQECLDRVSQELGDLVMRHVDERVRAALAEADQPGQLELRLDDLLPGKKAPCVPKVDPNSMLGAELSQMANLEAAVSQGVSDNGGVDVEPAETVAVPASPPRPLFVHRRARDGRIHELSRAGQPLPASG
jgi:hypothetical protein